MFNTACYISKTSFFASSSKSSIIPHFLLYIAVLNFVNFSAHTLVYYQIDINCTIPVILLMKVQVKNVILLFAMAII